jgi:hypothetical protein
VLVLEGVGPAVDVMSVGGRSDCVRSRQSRMVVLTGLPPRGRGGSWCLTTEVTVVLVPLSILGYGVAWERIERSVGECDERGLGGRIACCRCI